VIWRPHCHVSPISFINEICPFRSEHICDYDACASHTPCTLSEISLEAARINSASRWVSMEG
jgi:hypothetical protein